MSRAAAANWLLSHAGSCSFCGKAREKVHVLVGAAGHATKICDTCIALCCEILAEEVGFPPPRPVHPSAPPSLEDEQFQQRVGEILQRFAAEAETRRGDALDRAMEPGARDAPLDEYSCSFCDAPCKDVAKLICGPRVFICDGCVGEATAVVSHVLRAV